MAQFFIKSWLTGATRRLRACSSTPALDAELILSFCTGRSRAWLLTANTTDAITDSLVVAQCDFLLQKRLQGYPIAYLTGYKEFYGYLFAVCPGVLIPRPDSECLIEILQNMYPSDSVKTLRDVGTGSGVLALTLAQLFPHWHVIASDISPTSRRMFYKNCNLLQINNAEFLSRSLLAGGASHYDIIIANLPYLTPQEMRERTNNQHWKEPTLALNGHGPDGLKLIKKLIRQAKHRCHMLLLEADPRQMPTLTQYLAQYGFSNIQIQADLSGASRIIYAQSKN